LKIVQIGLGSFGRRWMDTVLEYEEWKYSAIATRDDKTRKELGELCGLPKGSRFTNLEEMLAHSEDADAVLITTPYFLHKDQILKSLRYGKHVVVEKPLCATMNEALEIREAVRESGKTLMVAENYRFRPGSILMRDLISSGEIGDPELILIQYFVKHRYPKSNWRNQIRYPILLENATHHFDLLRFITASEPVSVSGSAFGSRLAEYWKYPTVSSLFEMTGHLHTHFVGSWAYDGFRTPWEGVWRIHGTKGSILWDGDIKISKESGEKTIHLETSPQSDTSLRKVLKEFTAALQEERKPIVDIDDNIQTMRMVFSSIESIEKGTQVIVQ
jgi:predicted dehydrogenase